MNPSKENLELFNKIVDLHEKDLFEHLKSYRCILIQQILNTESSIEADKDFMVDMSYLCVKRSMIQYSEFLNDEKSRINIQRDIEAIFKTIHP